MVALRTQAQTLAHLRSVGGGFFAMRRWTVRTHLAALVALAAVACGRGERAPAAGPPGPPGPPGPAVTDDAGRRVALAQPARRIVSLLPSFTEILFAIGAGHRLVGRTAWCDYPPAALAVPSVGDGIPPNVEAVAARRPDLVVLYHSGQNAAAAQQLERLGIRTVLLDLNRLEELAPAARRLGVLTGRKAAGDSLARAMDSLVLHSPESPTPNPRSLVFVVWDNPPIVIGAGSYLDELAGLAGARNVFHDIAAPSAQVSIETIAARNPDFIAVLSDTAAPPRYARRPEWRVVPAVRNGRFLFLPGGLFGRPGPRASEAVRDLRRRLQTTP
jgi:iron complex transport system substrate-binding protein